MAKVVVALGSNIEPRIEYLKKAIQEIRKIGEVLSVSSLYETKPVGFEAEVDVLNAALIVDTELFPLALLERLKSIEADMGRVVVPGEGYTSRTIDLDIIFYERQVLVSEQLIIPHPSFSEREFVLFPVVEIAGEWVDPLSQLTIRKILADKKEMREPRIFAKS